MIEQISALVGSSRLEDGDADIGGLWRGPSGYTLVSWEADFRPGGSCRVCVRSPQGQDHWVDGVHLEIVEPERIVFSGNLRVEWDGLHQRPGWVTFRRI